MAKKQIIRDAIVLLYFAATTLLISYPLIFHLHDYIFGIGDELLITWIMNWNIYAFLHNPLHLFDANIFYPYQNTIAFSDSFLTSSLIALLPVLATKYPLIAYNINYLIGHIFLGFFTYLLVKFLCKDRWAALVSGTLATFSVYTVNQYVHLQLLSVQWIPLSMLFFFMFLKKKRFVFIFGSLLLFVVQVANSFLPGFFLVAFYIVSITYLYFADRKLLMLFYSKKILITGISTVLAVTWMTLPYFQVSHEFNYVRDIRDTIRFANRQEYIFYPNDRTRLQEILINTFYKHDTNQIRHDGYIGMPILFLGLLTIVFRIRKGKKFFARYFDVFFITAMTSYVLSLGPALQWFGKVIKTPFIIPLPYALLYYIVPGFKGFRNSARWEMLYVLTLSVLIGFFLTAIFRKKSAIYKAAISIVICLIVLLEINFPFKYVQMPGPKKFPPVYTYINSLSENSVIVELPIYNWNMLPYAYQENIRLYYSTLHHKRMVNGTSGFSPPKWQEDIVALHNKFPDKDTIRYIKSIHITHIVVHAEEFKALHKEFGNRDGEKYDWKIIERKLKSESSLKLVKTFGSDYVFEVQYD